MEDRNCLASITVTPAPTLNWGQDILEPRRHTWKTAASDALSMSQQAMKSVVKSMVKPAPDEMASCGKGRGWTIKKKLKEMSTMGPAAASWYPGDVDTKKKKVVAQKPTFPTKEEQEAKKRLEERKNKVINQSAVSIGERFTSISRQAEQYTQEVQALRSDLLAKCLPLQTGPRSIMS